MSALELLDDFRRRRSNEAFSELVHRYTNLVYSAAKRRLGSEMLAQDAAQAVFIRLASNPPSLSREAELTGWLHRTTLYVSVDLWRSEVRRRAREESAVAMQPIPAENSSWADIKPSLDEALDALDDSDREVILLRFFNHNSMRELGEAFGITEEAAKMRVSRAVGRLRDQLSSAGVTCSAASLGAFLADRAVEAAPAVVAAAITAVGYPIAETCVATVATSAGAVLSAAAKVGMALAALGMVGLTVWVVQRHPLTTHTTVLGRSVNAGGARATGAIALPGRTLNQENLAQTNQPDPVKMLEAVARARQRFASGSMEFQIDSFGAAFHSTNRLRISALFDAGRQRFEQIGREYSYTYDPDPAAQQEIKRKADAFGFDKDAAIQAGLLTGFEAHDVTIYNGQSLMKYRETDGKPESATVDDPKKGSLGRIFDPRSLGLSSYLGGQATVEDCLGRDAMKAAQLIGQEPVEGIPAWHLRVPAGYPLDIWLDVSDPVRVLKKEDDYSVVLSRYDTSRHGDPLPKDILIRRPQTGAVESEEHVVRAASRFNIVVEPETFTLQGLGMKVGTDVIDLRIHRSIGYWTGKGLSGDLPRKTSIPSVSAPNLEDMLAILDNFNPAADEAFDAAQWILLNTPDGAAVERALRIVLENHVQRPDLAPLCQQMERLRHRGVGAFLATVLKTNPHPEVQATACLALATLRKDESRHGEDTKAAAQAEELFERVKEQFSQAGPKAADRCWKAKEALLELRRMSIGKLAPDFEGQDLKGRSIQLSALRGKVVVVVFWYASNLVAPEENLLVLAPFADKGVVCLSIYCDDDRDRATPVLEKYPPPGPVIWDGNHGPIADGWQVHGWPSVFVLDHEGVIRARNARGPELAQAVTKLLAN